MVKLRGEILKSLRAVVAALCFTVITMALVGVPGILGLVGAWGCKIQIGAAIMGLSAAVLIAWFVITLVFGRIYCSTVCPLGAIQDAVAASRRGRIYRYRKPAPILALMLLVAALVSLLTGITSVMAILDPMAAYERIVECFTAPTWRIIAISAVTLIVVGVMAWQGGRLFCNTICPIGAALGIISRASALHIEIDPDRCTRCRNCVDRCKAQCIEIDTCTVDHSRCVVCFNCLTDCPNDAIAYTINRHRLMTPMFQRIDAPKTEPQVSADGAAQNSVKQPDTHPDTRNETVS